MGYRSEVVLAIDAKIVPALMAAFAKCEETQRFCTQYVDDLDTDYNGKGNWMMHWHDVKWYDSFPEIGMLNSLIEAMECDELDDFGIKVLENHDGEGYNEMFRFVRIGEEHEDMETRGHGFNIGVLRGIDL